MSNEEALNKIKENRRLFDTIISEEEIEYLFRVKGILTTVLESIMEGKGEEEARD